MFVEKKQEKDNLIETNNQDQALNQWGPKFVDNNKKSMLSM